MSISDEQRKREAKEMGISLFELARLEHGETMEDILARRERVAKLRARMGLELAADTWRRILGAKKD
jgi:hypothetical protein